jgi:peptidoglycan hydrolase-like protein with peptidoglycan-binding domain
VSLLNLKSDISKSHKLEEEDVLKAKIALNKEGYYDVPDYGMTPYSDERMFDGMKKFQKEKGLQVDGVMRPDGETVNALDKSLAKHQSPLSSSEPDLPPKKNCPPGKQNRLDTIGIPGTSLYTYWYICVDNPIPSGTRW